MHAVVHRVMFRDIHNQLNDALYAVGAGGIDVSLMDWPLLADRLVQLTIPDFEYPRRDLPANVTYVGPVLPEPPVDFEPPAWWDEALEAETIVHVTQGTLDNGDLDQLIGPSLRALADVEGVAVIVTTGRREDPRPLTDIPSNAYVAEWIPYRALLPHVDVMITNGGYGGTQHALRYGIPVVIGGESADKAEVAARVEYAGVGVNLGTAHPTPEAIAAAVREAAGCRVAAAQLGRKIAKTTSARHDRVTARRRSDLGVIWSRSPQQNTPNRYQSPAFSASYFLVMCSMALSAVCARFSRTSLARAAASSVGFA